MNGIKITFEDDYGASYTKSSATVVTITRGRISNVGSVNCAPEDAATATYYGTANCILVESGQSVAFDAAPYYTTSPRYSAENNVSTAATAVASAALLWRETALVISGVNYDSSTKKVTVAVGSGTGNAVVAIKDSDNNILWSYHIWVPETDPRTGLLTYNRASTNTEGVYQTFKVMPMMLGATSVVTAGMTIPEKARGIGLYYQWGRKDPLGRVETVQDFTSGSTTLSKSNYAATVDGSGASVDWATEKVVRNDVLGGVTGDDRNPFMVDYVTKNPMKYIDNGGTNAGPWFGNFKKLWGNPRVNTTNQYCLNSEIRKSVYDPCPAGYKVAPGGIFIYFATSSYLVNAADSGSQGSDGGCAFYYNTETTDTDFYLLSAKRDYSRNGAFYGVGDSGYCWSSLDVDTGSGKHVRFSSSNNYNCYTFDSSDFTNAYPVRCVKDAE